MPELVFINDGRPVTDSLTVAETFGKRHDRVLQDIRELGCSTDFRLHHFVESTYENQQGRTMPRFLMTEQGFVLLVMGYTGSEAMQFKETYIAAFDQMRESLSAKPAEVVPLSKDQALVTVLRTTADLVEGQQEIRQLVAEQAQKIEQVTRKVDEQITIDHGEQRRVQRAVASRIYGITGDKEERSRMFRELYREIKDRWAVGSYRDVRRTELDSVLRYVAAWVPRAVA